MRKRPIKFAVGGFLIGLLVTFGFLFFHESRDELATMPALILMGLM